MARSKNSKTYNLIRLFDLGSIGVDLVHSPIHVPDGGWRQLQNGLPSPNQALGGIRTRSGLKGHADENLGAAVKMLLNVPLATSVFSPAAAPATAGVYLALKQADTGDPTWLYTADAGDNWAEIEAATLPAAWSDDNGGMFKVFGADAVDYGSGFAWVSKDSDDVVTVKAYDGSDVTTLYTFPGNLLYGMTEGIPVQLALMGSDLVVVVRGGTVDGSASEEADEGYVGYAPTGTLVDGQRGAGQSFNTDLGPSSGIVTGPTPSTIYVDGLNVFLGVDNGGVASSAVRIMKLQNSRSDWSYDFIPATDGSFAKTQIGAMSHLVSGSSKYYVAQVLSDSAGWLITSPENLTAANPSTHTWTTETVPAAITNYGQFMRALRGQDTNVLFFLCYDGTDSSIYEWADGDTAWSKTMDLSSIDAGLTGQWDPGQPVHVSGTTTYLWPINGSDNGAVLKYDGENDDWSLVALPDTYTFAGQAAQV